MRGAPDAVFRFSVVPEAAHEVGQGSHTETKKLQGGTKEKNLIRVFSFFQKKMSKWPDLREVLWGSCKTSH